MSVRTSRCGAPKAPGCVRSPGGSSGAVDHLTGVAPQRLDPHLPPGLQGIHRAVACRAAGPPPKTAKLVVNDRLRQYVQDKLSGVIRGADGQVVVGPAGTPWKGRNKPHRGDRAWVTAWSPEQIARRLPVDFPDDEFMRISHEAIYQALYVETRGALKRDLVGCYAAAGRCGCREHGPDKKRGPMSRPRR